MPWFWLKVQDHKLMEGLPSPSDGICQKAPDGSPETAAGDIDDVLITPI